MFIYMYMLNKTNKYQINAKMYGKIFFIFFIFEQKIISQNKKEKMQNDNYFTQWAKGCKMEKECAKSKTNSGPAQVNLLQPPALFQTENARFTMSNTNS